MNAVDQLKTTLSYIDSKIIHLQPGTDQRSVVVGVLADVTIEHGKSMIVLIENRLFASALTLARPHFESGVKTLWLNRCATDQQIDRYAKKGRIDNISNMKDMVDTVETKADAGGVLKHIHDLAWKAMNSFLHVRNMQISQRFQSEDNTVHWNEGIEGELCQIIGVMILLAYTEILMISKAADLDKQVSRLTRLLEPVIVPVKNQ